MNEFHHSSQDSLLKIPRPHFGHVTFNTLRNGLKDAFEILRLNKSRMEEVAGRHHEGTGLAFVYWLLPQLIGALGGVVVGYAVPFLGIVHLGFSRFTGVALSTLFLSAASFYFGHFIAVKFFKGKADFGQYFRVLGYASLLNLLDFFTIFPVLQFLAGLWFFVLWYNCLRQVHQLQLTDAFFTLFLVLIFIGVLSFFLNAVGFLPMSSGLGGASFSLTY